MVVRTRAAHNLSSTLLISVHPPAQRLLPIGKVMQMCGLIHVKARSIPLALFSRRLKKTVHFSSFTYFLPCLTDLFIQILPNCEITHSALGAQPRNSGSAGLLNGRKNVSSRPYADNGTHTLVSRSLCSVQRTAGKVFATSKGRRLIGSILTAERSCFPQRRRNAQMQLRKPMVCFLG
jgi:hypothetical protein